jgi:hypothetical protein
VGWIEAAGHRLYEAAGEHGGICGNSFIVYHGEVTEDSDGPVEICLPVAAPAASAGPIRTEPAHREVDVRLVRSQVEYPQILSAYDAVERWVAARDRDIAGPPREVYFSDFGAAGPDDEVCDVAFPVSVPAPTPRARWRAAGRPPRRGDRSRRRRTTPRRRRCSPPPVVVA